MGRRECDPRVKKEAAARGYLDGETGSLPNGLAQEMPYLK
jgi:hypothetical protein